MYITIMRLYDARDECRCVYAGGAARASGALASSTGTSTRALVRGASGPVATPPSIASAPSATEVEVGGLVGLWGAAGAEAMGGAHSHMHASHAHEGMDMHDVRAVAQVQWGLRRWRQLAGQLERESPAPQLRDQLRTTLRRTTSAHGPQQRRRSPEPHQELSDVMLADLIPPGMRRVQADAERALRIRAPSPSHAAAVGVALRRSAGAHCDNNFAAAAAAQAPGAVSAAVATRAPSHAPGASSAGAHSAHSVASAAAVATRAYHSHGSNSVCTHAHAADASVATRANHSHGTNAVPAHPPQPVGGTAGSAPAAPPFLAPSIQETLSSAHLSRTAGSAAAGAAAAPLLPEPLAQEKSLSSFLSATPVNSETVPMHAHASGSEMSPDESASRPTPPSLLTSVPSQIYRSLI